MQNISRCPICGQLLERSKVCPNCGYDPAREYEIYPTLERIPEKTASFSAKRLKWERTDSAHQQESGIDKAEENAVNRDADKDGKSQPIVVSKGLIIGIAAALIIGLVILFTRPEKQPGQDTGEGSTLQSESESVYSASEETQTETEVVQSESEVVQSESESETVQSKRQETETEAIESIQEEEDTDTGVQQEVSTEQEYTSEKIREIAKNVWLGTGEWNGDPNSECGFYEGENPNECGFLMYSDNGSVFKSNNSDGIAVIEDSDIDLGSKLIGQSVYAQKYTWTEKSQSGEVNHTVLYIARVDDGSILIMAEDEEEEHYYHLSEGDISEFIKIHEDLMEKINRLREIFSDYL